MMIIDEILKWVESKLPTWQSDAMRRIWRKNDLDETDKDEILRILKREFGLLKEDTGIPDAIKLSTKDIGKHVQGEKPSILKSIEDVLNVNALEEDQVLNFDAEGLTVVYGENASGKSGYARILKKACMARGEDEKIIPNITIDTNEVGPASATFKYDKGGTIDASFQWRENEINESPIADIAVFDSKCARVIVDEKNAVIYEPYGLDTITKLVKLCDWLNHKLQEEIQLLEKEPEAISKLVGNEKLIKIISYKTNKDKLRELGEYTNEDESKYVDLTVKKANIIKDDKKDEIKRYENRLRQIYELRKRLFELRRLFADSSIKELEHLRKKMVASRAAAQLASKEIFENEPLVGVGSQTWKEMFLAAKRYSEMVAYPNEEFPYTGEVSRCPLCQQTLDLEAKERLEKFWEFLQEDLEIVVRNDVNAYNQFFAKITGFDHGLYNYNILIEEISTDENRLLQYFENFQNDVNTIKEKITNIDNTGFLGDIPRLDAKLAVLLVRYTKEIKTKMDDLQKTDRTEEKKKIEKEIENLEGKRLLSENIDEICDYIDRLNEIRTLQKIKNSTNTMGLTKKRKELMGYAINAELKDALNNELRLMGAGHLNLAISHTGKKGYDYTVLKLQSCAVENVKIENILSEGEHRVVAIASFLAEMQLAPNNSSIVFDDPVRSLDHRWREKIANRLVSFAKERQVIIFTHDITFLLDLEQAANFKDIRLNLQTIERFGNKVGICGQEEPWIILNVKSRIRKLKEKVTVLKRIYENGNKTDYETNVCQFYSRLRSTWERLVEEILFHKVVCRFGKNISSKELRYVEVTDEDYRIIDMAMTRCSDITDAHDKSTELGESLPIPEDLDFDLVSMETFYKEIKNRNNDVEKRRKYINKI